jgi:hypothetical protein
VFWRIAKIGVELKGKLRVYVSENLLIEGVQMSFHPLV